MGTGPILEGGGSRQQGPDSRAYRLLESGVFAAGSVSHRAGAAGERVSASLALGDSGAQVLGGESL